MWHCHQLPHSAEFSTDEEALGYSLVGVIDVSLRDFHFHNGGVSISTIALQHRAAKLAYALS